MASQWVVINKYYSWFAFTVRLSWPKRSHLRSKHSEHMFSTSRIYLYVTCARKVVVLCKNGVFWKTRLRAKVSEARFLSINQVRRHEPMGLLLLLWTRSLGILACCELYRESSQTNWWVILAGKRLSLAVLLALFYRYLVTNGSRQYKESDFVNTNGAGIFVWKQVTVTDMAHDEILLLYNNKKRVILTVLHASSRDG